MPSIELFVQKMPVAGVDSDGCWPVIGRPPSPPRIPLRQLVAMVRCRPHSGAYRILLDTGAPLSVFPFALCAGRWNWQPGRDFEELSVVGLGGRITGQVSGGTYTARLVRARVPVELSGNNVGPPLRLDHIIVQLADPGGGPPLPLLGLWGNALDGRSLHITRTPDDDLAARLDAP